METIRRARTRDTADGLYYNIQFRYIMCESTRGAQEAFRTHDTLMTTTMTVSVVVWWTTSHTLRSARRRVWSVNNHREQNANLRVIGWRTRSNVMMPSRQQTLSEMYTHEKDECTTYIQQRNVDCIQYIIHFVLCYDTKFRHHTGKMLMSRYS